MPAASILRHQSGSCEAIQPYLCEMAVYMGRVHGSCKDIAASRHQSLRYTSSSRVKAVARSGPAQASRPRIKKATAHAPPLNLLSVNEEGGGVRAPIHGTPDHGALSEAAPSRHSLALPPSHASITLPQAAPCRRAMHGQCPTAAYTQPCPSWV